MTKVPESKIPAESGITATPKLITATPKTPRRRRCTGKTKAGKRCQAAPLKGATRCAAHPTHPTPKNARAWAPTFLEALEQTHMVTAAAKRAGIHRDTAYSLRAEDPEFARDWSEIEERSTELLEREAMRRAAEGVDRPVYQGGELVGEVREYSDTLLIFLLKARRPQVYREQHQVEHVGPGGGPIAAEIVAVDEFDADTRKLAHDLLARAAGRTPKARPH